MDDVDRAFREALWPAVATLVRVFGDMSLAEDAVQDAFVSAMDRWPRDGIPDNPAGWIVATARNRAVDVVRREARGRELSADVAAELDTYYLLHAARATMLRRLGRTREARAAFLRAADLAPTEYERRFLRERPRTTRKH